ncbi:MAG: Gfo/Idh/MocA family oxidoreductase [Sedimentisphaerales bacterium]|jgi:predicted dehydrogenase|nr:Gfo/Idh/MocA family oxidoreductase [Sedimentisphaerales bacterium]NLT76975.1 Gfo/Idh/MocA family oxidoreductase [Planctomycetota bacterium]
MANQNGRPATDISRRRFVGHAAAMAAFTVVPRHVLGGPRHVAPSEKLNIAGIGVGGRGGDDLRGVESERIVALCDVDWQNAADAFRRYPDARRYRDFREMLDKEGDGIDAVVIATPDHVHAVASMAAIKKGRHVYCEKPLTRTVHEARALTLAAREARVATQMGNQGMAFEGNRLIKEWLWDGAIGDVREVHVWSDRPTHQGKLPLWWAQGIERPTDTPAVPEHLDWDLWLGPAPYRPYHPAYVPFRWRGWWDFGSGGLGDMGIHNLAPVFSALKLGAPTGVCASSTAVYEETLPLASTVHYEFPARGDMPAVTLHWYDGGLIAARPRELEDSREMPREDGLIFVGDKGKMLVTGWGGHSPRLIPETKMKAYRQPPKSLPRSIGHYEEWIKACKEGTPTESSFDFAGPMTEAVLLGTVCVRAGGGRLLWDSQAMRITNRPEANDHLHYAYREPWTL